MAIHWMTKGSWAHSAWHMCNVRLLLMCGRNSRPKRVSGFVLCCEVCALQLQATCKTSSQTRHDLIQSGVHSVACSNTKRLPVPRSKDERNARKLQLLQTSSLSGVPSSRFPVLPTGIAALLLMGRSVCACTSASSSVVQAHILGQEREKKCLIVVTVTSTSCGLRLWCRIWARKSPKVAGNWAQFLACPLRGAGLWWNGHPRDGRWCMGGCSTAAWSSQLIGGLWNWCWLGLGWTWLGLIDKHVMHRETRTAKLGFSHE